MRPRAVLAATVMIIPAVTATLPIASTAFAADPGDLVITEVMQNPSAVADGSGEWFEITNVSADDVDLENWTIADEGIDSHLIAGSVVVPAGGTIVLGNNADSATNGGLTVDYDYGSSWFLANGDDEIILSDPNGIEIDRIEYDGGADWPDPNGASMSLDPAATDNNIGANWCEATTPFGTGDLGTPGGPNPSCGGGLAGDLVITEVMQNPSAVFDGSGEWFEVTNVSADDVDLENWTIADNDFDSHVIAGSVVVPAGGTIVLGNNADSATNGGVTVGYDYGSSWFLANGADEIVLSDPNGIEIDRIEYDGGAFWPDPNGASMSLDPASTDATLNDDGPNWCEATTPFGDGDLGTPGAANSVCEIAPLPVTPISAIQGSGSSVAISGAVRVEAVVTSLFERDDVLDGFFIQEEDADADADPATSEGIFVFCRANCPAPLAIGDLIDVTGTATEFFGMSQIDIAFGNGTANVVNSGNPLPTPTPVTLPASGSTSAEATFESTEGMVVTFPGQLVVSEYFELARYGQLVLTDSARPFQFTDQNEPSVAGYAAFLADLATRRIILDDDNNDQNDAISDGPDEPYPYPSGGLSIDNRFRGGDTIDDLTGVMHWSFAGQSGTDAWRIRPIDGVEYTFESVNPEPDSPDDVGGRITAASFNVLNLFSTIDLTSSNSVGSCGPSGALDCRGADSETELVRQQAKIAAAIAKIDADVVGLIELENDGDDKSVRDLVGVVNSVAGAGTYDYIPTGFIGDDAIKVGFIYQPALVTPVGDFAVLDESVDPRFLDSKNRPMLVQTFEENLTGARFTAAVNHLKSKGSGCDDVGDPGLNDGQANCPATRAAAASAIADYLATDPTGGGDADVLILGDLNSYAMETPITILKDAGYTDLLDSFVGPDAYTYVFDGQLGYLDYALANGALVGQITGATAWHVNADEIPLFDYNDDVRDIGESSFERESTVGPLYEPDALRSSDHDPVIVGIDLDIDVATVIGLTIERVDALEADGDLNSGQANALRRRLAQALHQYEIGRIDSTIDILTGVVDQLDEFVDDGVLSADEAAPLRAAIVIVLDTID